MSKTKYRYLIVEDDPSFAEILKVVASKVEEIELLAISDNTLDAAKKIDLEKPDILLLDINISGLEGPEVLELSEHKPKTIVISSHPEEVMDNYEVDYVAFIQKPLQNAEQLTGAIHKCIDRL